MSPAAPDRVPSAHRPPLPPRQLCLPFGVAPRRFEVVSGAVRLAVRLEPSGASFEVDLWGGATPDAPRRLDLRVVRPVAAEVGAWRLGDLRPGAEAPRARDRAASPDLLVLLAEEVRLQLPEVAGTWAALLESARRHLAALADPDAAAAARPFAPGGMTQWFVYAAAANDPTGRVAQLAATAPAVLLVAHRLETRGRRAEARALLGEAVAGVRRDALLDRAVAALAGPDDDPARRIAWRVLLRRAGPQVPAHLLCAPPPSPLVPEDIPPRSRPRANAAWYRAMDALRRARPQARLPRPAQAGLLAFVSRRAPRLVRLGASVGLAPDVYLDRLARALAVTGRRTSRHTDPDRLHEALAPLLRWLGRPGTPPPETPLPPGPFAGRGALWVAGRQVRRLETVGAVWREGVAMGSCVPDLLAELLEGFSHLFHVDGPAGGLTVQARWAEAGPEVIEARGALNRLPTAEEAALVARWARAAADAPARAG